MLPFSSVMFWTHDHEAILCREVVNVNPYTTKKGSTQKKQNVGRNSRHLDDKPKRQRRSGGDAIEQGTNKAFLGLSLMMPWLFLRKNCRKITLIKSTLQPRRLASRRTS